MRVWVDAQLPPAIAAWISQRFGIPCSHIRDTDLAAMPDAHIFERIRVPGDVIFTKDEDFIDLVTRLDPPPQVLWLRIGNTSNRHLRTYLEVTMGRAIELLSSSEPVVELAPLAKPS